MTGIRRLVILAAVVGISGVWLVGHAAAPGDETKARRVVPVTNVVPKSAQPIHGAVVKVEVLDAVDLKGSSWQLKVAVRVRNARAMRVRCSLKLQFDGKPMGQPWLVDLPDGQSDLVVFACYCGEGKGADQLSKLTAETSNIRLGD